MIPNAWSIYNAAIKESITILDKKCFFVNIFLIFLFGTSFTDFHMKTFDKKNRS